MIITMVGYPKDVEEVYFKEGGIVESAPAGAILADMTTTSPKLAVRIFEAAGARGAVGAGRAGLRRRYRRQERDAGDHGGR